MFKPFQSLYARMVDAMLLYAFLLKMPFKSSMTLIRSSMSERDEAQGARNTETGMYLKYMRISSTAQRRDSPAQPLI
jgi:hypothetical protein